jgi:hypothetical protein
MPLPLRPLLSQNVKAGVNRAKIETIASRETGAPGRSSRFARLARHRQDVGMGGPLHGRQLWFFAVLAAISAVLALALFWTSFPGML